MQVDDGSMGMNKTMTGLIFGVVIGWLVGTALENSSICTIGERSIVGGGSSPFAFCTMPIIIVFALVGFWLGKQIEHDAPLY